MNGRPDVKQVLNILMELLYNIPQKGLERTNELFSRARELFIDELSLMDSENDLLCECIVCTLCNICLIVC